MSLIWNGDAVIKEMTLATRKGIDETMGKCVVMAKNQLYPGHGWEHGWLHGSLKMEPSAMRGTHVVGTWGSFDIDYALYIEQGNGRFSGYNYLRSSADFEYPKLAGRIRAHREAA